MDLGCSLGEHHIADSECESYVHWHIHIAADFQDMIWASLTFGLGYRNYRHPTRLLNFIAESREANLTISQHRRATDFFKTPNVRLTCQQNTIFFKGPKLYNNLVNEINAKLGEKETKLEKRYVKPFKNLVKRHLIDIQKLGSPENWSQENFKLYNI